MRYFKIESEEAAAKLSASLYACMCPGGSETQYLFGWETHLGQTYIMVPEIEQPTNEKTAQKLADAREVLKTDFTYDNKMTNPVSIVSLVDSLEEVSEEIFLKDRPTLDELTKDI